MRRLSATRRPGCVHSPGQRARAPAPDAAAV